MLPFTDASVAPDAMTDRSIPSKFHTVSTVRKFRIVQQMTNARSKPNSVHDSCTAYGGIQNRSCNILQVISVSTPYMERPEALKTPKVLTSSLTRLVKSSGSQSPVAPFDVNLMLNSARVQEWILLPSPTLKHVVPIPRGPVRGPLIWEWRDGQHLGPFAFLPCFFRLNAALNRPFLRSSIRPGRAGGLKSGRIMLHWCSM